MRSKQLGFTLIELIIVIVILGIISAIALPKFINLGHEARLAKVNAMAGTLTSTANLVYAKCLAKETCDVSIGSQAINMEGVGYQLVYGFPDAGDGLNNYQIDTMINVSGFDLGLVDYSKTIFKVPNAPDPDQCAVVYQEPVGTSRVFTVTQRTGGC